MAHYPVDEYFKIPQTYSRADWGAKKPKHESPTQLPAIYMVFRRTDTDSCHNKEECMRVVREIQEQDMADGLPDIQYNFLIGNDGTIYEGRGWHSATEPFPDNVQDYTTQLHTRSILVGLIGDFEGNRPDHKQEMAVLNLVGVGATKKYLHDNLQFLHYREVAYKQDPYNTGF